MKVESVELAEDQYFGRYFIVVVDSDASEALKLNLKLLEAFGFPILVEWKGKIDISSDKIADLLAEILIKSGIRLDLEEGYSVVKAIEEDRDES